MRNLVKIGLVAISIGIFTSGCLGCGDGDRARPHGVIDTAEAAKKGSAKKVIDTSKAAIDTAKKDTTKK